VALLGDDQRYLLHLWLVMIFWLISACTNTQYWSKVWGLLCSKRLNII